MKSSYRGVTIKETARDIVQFIFDRVFLNGLKRMIAHFKAYARSFKMSNRTYQSDRKNVVKRRSNVNFKYVERFPLS